MLKSLQCRRYGGLGIDVCTPIIMMPQVFTLHVHCVMCLCAEEGKYLEGEDRISYLMSKITDLRKIYMGLKAEVACIDRRRKRHKRKEREGTSPETLSPV